MSVSVVGIVGAGKHALLCEPTEQPLMRSREKLAVTLDKADSRGAGSVACTGHGAG